MKAIYLDYAAATPLDERVLKAMMPFLFGKFQNPSAIYLAGRDIRQALELARSQIAQCLGTRPAEIIFTSGATEANNLAIQGVMRKHPGANLVVSAIEHESVLAPTNLFNHKLASVDKFGLVDIKKLAALIDDKTVLLSIMLVNNEIGSVQPLSEIAHLIKKIRTERLRKDKSLPLLLHTDAAQATNYFDLHAARLGVDLMTINGAKIYGPKQSGFLYIKAGVELEPLIRGGGQEFGLRSGTENLAGAVGLATALTLSQSSRFSESKRLNQLRADFVDKLRKRFPEVIISGHPKHYSPHIVHVTFPGYDNERLMMQLDELGIEAAVGSACSADNVKPSHVLKAIGMSDELARSSLRFSFGRQTSLKDLSTTIRALSKMVKGVNS